MTSQGAAPAVAAPVVDDGAQLQKPKQMKPRNVFLMIGCTLLLLVTLLPLLDANRLLEDSTFVFFVGRELPRRLMWCCIGSIMLYMFLIYAFFACAQEEAKTEQSIALIVAVVLTTMGLSFLMVSIPLKREAMLASQEIFSNCQFGPRTQRLYEYSTVLQGIRASPACSVLKSVTMCDGYQESMPYTGFLYSLESTYNCAGFCYGNSTMAAAAAAVASEPYAPNTMTTSMPSATEAEAPAALYSVPSVPSSEQAIQAAAPAATPAFYSAFPNIPTNQGYMMSSPQQVVLPTAANVYGSQMLMPSPQATAAFAPNPYYSAQAIQSVAPQNVDSRMLGVSFLASKDGASGDAANPHEPHTYAGFSQALRQAPGPPVLADTTTPIPANETHATPGIKAPYPPTLFSNKNFQASCDGMAARELLFQAEHIANMVYLYGIFLLGSVLFGGLLRMCGFCIQLPAPRWKKPILTGTTPVH